MSNRVSVAELEEIIDIDSSVTDARITVFITQANLMVSAAFSGDTTVGESTLKEIERNVAAHFIRALIGMQEVSEKAGEVSVTYAGKFGEFLKGSSFGQMALMLDPTGKLARVGRTKASFKTVDYSTSL
jgi:hypothetical protein